MTQNPWITSRINSEHALSALWQSQKGTFTEVGYFDLPFYMTLQRLRHSCSLVLGIVRWR
jgi:hypothetical protein